MFTALVNPAWPYGSQDPCFEKANLINKHTKLVIVEFYYRELLHLKLKTT